jgi:hypothetical protein
MKTLLTCLSLLALTVSFAQRYQWEAPHGFNNVPTFDSSFDNSFDKFVKSKKFGLTRKTAIIADARTAQEGIQFEHKWIDRNYPHSDIIDFKMEGAGEYRKGIPSELYDIYIIRTNHKKKLKIYFMVMYYHGRN